MIPPPLIALAFIIGLATLLVAWSIMRDRTRYLARFQPLRHPGVSAEYLAGLSNFLEKLHDRRTNSAWPRRHDALSVLMFCLRTRAFSLGPSKPAARLIAEHLTLWAQLELLKPFIQQAILGERQRIAVSAILELPDTPERDRLMHFVNDIRQYRDGFARALSPSECRLYHELERTHYLLTLRKIHAVFDEHGYALGPRAVRRRFGALPPDVRRRPYRPPLRRRTGLGRPHRAGWRTL